MASSTSLRRHENKSLNMLAAKTSAEVQMIVKVPNTHKGAMAIWVKKAAASSDSDAEMTRLREMFDRSDIKHVCIVKLHAQDLHKKGYSPNWENYDYSTLHCDRADEQREKATKEVIKYFEKVYESHAMKLEGYQALLHDLGLENGMTIAKCKEILKDAGSRGCFINIYDFIDADRKAYRHPAVEPLRYYSIVLDKIFPKKRAKQHTILRNLLVNMLGRYKGEQYDKGRESVGIRVRNLKLSYTAGYAKDAPKGNTGSTPKRKKKASKGKDARKDATLAGSQAPIMVGNDGKTSSTPKHKQKPRKRKHPRRDATLALPQAPIKDGNDGSAVSAIEVSDSDDTSEPKTPGDEIVVEATNLMKRLGIPNGV